LPPSTQGRGAERSRNRAARVPARGRRARKVAWLDIGSPA